MHWSTGPIVVSSFVQLYVWQNAIFGSNTNNNDKTYNHSLSCFLFDFQMAYSGWSSQFFFHFEYIWTTNESIESEREREREWVGETKTEKSSRIQNWKNEVKSCILFQSPFCHFSCFARRTVHPMSMRSITATTIIPIFMPPRMLLELVSSLFNNKHQ